MKPIQAVSLGVVALLTLGMQQGVLAQTASPIALESGDLSGSWLTGESIKCEPLTLGALAEDSSTGGGWRFELHSWLWAAGIEGDVGARGRQASVDSTFMDIWDASDSLIGIAGRFEVGYDRWGLFVDGMYNRIGVEGATGPLGLADVDVTMEMGIVDFGVMYRLGEWRVEKISADSTHTHVTLDAYAGARYTTLTLELDPANFPSVDRDKNWIDPIVGAKLVVPLTDKFHFAVWGDVGGFGVSSDFTWSATGILSYDFPLFGLDATAFVGYRGLGDDYSDGSGTDRFVWDVTMSGPIIGLDIRF